MRDIVPKLFLPAWIGLVVLVWWFVYRATKKPMPIPPAPAAKAEPDTERRGLWGQ